MIRENTIEAVYPLAEILASKGIELSPRESTPLSSLVTAGHFPNTAYEDGYVTHYLLEGSRAKDLSGNYRHDGVMKEMAELISNAVRVDLNNARNVVNPIIKEVAEATARYIEAGLSVRKTHVAVKPVFLNEIWNSPALADMVERFEEAGFDEIVLNTKLDMVVDKPTLLGLAKTGAVTFDGELENLCSGLSEEYVISLFNSVFNGAVVTNLSTYVNSELNPNNALLVHLWARKMLLEIPEGVNVPLSQFKAYISSIIEQSGRAITTILSRRERDLKLKKLVRAWPSNLGRLGYELVEIEVNGLVYNQWLEAGGSPEVLFGSLISDQQKGFQELLDRAQEYTADWNRRERTLNTKDRLEKFNLGVEGMRVAISDQINGFDYESGLIPVGKEILHERLNKLIGGLYGKFYDDLYAYSRKMVCTIMFPHTNSLELLCAIDNACEDNPDLDVREAALWATIEIVASWVSKLMLVKQVRPE